MAILSLSLLCSLLGGARGDGNRLTYLDGDDPYYVSVDFPRLTTPQWVGEEGVEAVVILAIDDMREIGQWEGYLRPILERLKRIDGRAPVSIMTNRIDPADPHLQKWLGEGLSLETHTLDHPCPLLHDGDFERARKTYERCVDLMAQIPGNRPVAFRMPCCDSLNTVSPRFFRELFNRRTAAGHFLQADSSVFNIITSNDSQLPRELVFDDDGQERFRRYVPFESYVNTVENYPYPYVIGRLAWEFPCVVPSDWSAQHVQQPRNPRTVDDLKAALDAVVIKQGVFDLVFHPYDWLRSDQIVELVDYADKKFGGRIKFLNFREACDRLTEHLLAGQPLRAADGGDNGVRLLDLNDDGLMDVVIANEQLRQTRVWSVEAQRWIDGKFPVELVKRDTNETRHDAGVRFGIVRPDRAASMLIADGEHRLGWHFVDGHWVEDPRLVAGLEVEGQPLSTVRDAIDQGVRLVDLNGDDTCELIAGGASQTALFGWQAEVGWSRLPFGLPEGMQLVDAAGHDRGLRLVDLDDDRQLDIVYSNEAAYAVHRFESLASGWGPAILAARRDEGNAVPMIVRGMTNNGAWFHSRHLWVQNEDTSRLNDLVDRRSFNELLADSPPRARSPEASLAALKVRDGLVAEVVAAEPLIADPVAFDWSPDGRLWVAEMADYPRPPRGEKGGGRIRVVEDSDGDGKYDRSHVFLEGLRHPNGIKWWRDGVLITSAPDILYAADTTGDGRADVQEVLYTGFAMGNPQHVVNGLRWGLDNWFYGANGDSGGRVTSVKTNEEVDIGGRDFRLRPDSGRIEPQSGYTQFIRARDDWNNWFGNSNSNPMWHYVLDDHYLGRNPYVASPDGRQDVAEVPGVAPVYPLSRTLERFNDYHTANRFTSACSSIIYRDSLLGTAFEGNSFVSEPVHNLVHREVVRPEGFSFRSRRAPDEQRTEFLASTDNWFRPTMLRTGPDGGLWVADMYRLVIEHPEWIPPSMQRGLDLRAGSDQGRIYRIRPVGVPLRKVPRFDQLSSAELVEVFESPNGWQRDMAQQLLIEREAPDIGEQLEAMVQHGRSPTARLHALCTLDGSGMLRAEVLLGALRDEHPGVRRHAIRVSEPLLADHPEVGEAIVELVDDADPQVVLQLAYSLGEWHDPRAGTALARLAQQYRDQPYVAAAVLSSALPHLDTMVAALLSETPDAEPPADLLGKLLGMASATEKVSVVTAMLPALQVDGGEQAAPWQIATMGQLLDMLQRRGTSLADLHEQSDDATRSQIEDLQGLFDAARETVADLQAEESSRVAAVRLLGRGLSQREEDDIQLLRELLTPQHSRAVQETALQGLAGMADEGMPALLLAGWKGYGPAMRSDVLGVLFSRDSWQEACLAALEAGTILPSEVDALRRQRLLEQKTPQLRERAEVVFAGAADSDRRRVVEEFRTAVSSSGDATRGAEVFVKRCNVCHRLDGKGHAIGPDLSALTDKSTEALLVAILDPNRAIESKFVSYSAATLDGLTHTGLLANETSTSITLRGQEGKEQVILRTDLDVLESSGKSLMPEGLERDLTKQDLADVIAHLQGVSVRPKRIAGNQPEVVQPDALRREFFCLPSNCEMFGETLRLEEVNGALGYWNSESDLAVWTIEVPRTTLYDVMLEWSCEDTTAGNFYLLEVGDQRLTGEVEGTGDWNTFRRETVGQVRLEAGRHRLGLRSNGSIEGALLDLKSITLRPRRSF